MSVYECSKSIVRRLLNEILGVVNLQHACAVSVAVVRSVCASINQHLTSQMSNHALNGQAYTVAYKHPMLFGDFSVMTAFTSYGV